MENTGRYPGMLLLSSLGYFYYSEAIIHKMNAIDNNIAGAKEAETQYGDNRFSIFLSIPAITLEIAKQLMEEKYTK